MDLLRLGLAAQPESLGDGRLTRVLRGYCISGSCESYYYLFTFREHASVAWPALAAAAFVAVSPPALYYSRYFIQETILAALNLAVFVAARAWWRTGLTRWALALPGCLSAPVIARMYGITKQALHKRAAAIRAALPVGDAARFKPQKR